MRITFLAGAFVRMACHMRFMSIGRVMMRQLMRAVVVRFFGSMVMPVIVFMIMIMSMVMTVVVVMVVVMVVIVFVFVTVIMVMFVVVLVIMRQSRSLLSWVLSVVTCSSGKPPYAPARFLSVSVFPSCSNPCNPGSGC